VGKMVTCLELLPAGWARDDLPRGYSQQISRKVGPLWRVDRLIDWGKTEESQKFGFPTSLRVIPDGALMPIRPGPDKDALPVKVPVHREAA